jgi:hypothetical protein
MIILGYIISKNKDKFFPEDIFKFVSSEEECVCNVPKMVLGLKEAKAYAQREGFEFDILERQFPDGNWWSFKKTEKRDIYEQDVVRYKEYIKEKVNREVKYYYANVLTLPFTKKKNLYNIIVKNALNRDNNYVIVDKKMVYYPLENGNVVGLSLDIMDYLNIKQEKILNLIRTNTHNKIYFTSSKNMWDIKAQFCGNEYVIAYLFQKFARKKN